MNKSVKSAEDQCLSGFDSAGLQFRPNNLDLIRLFAALQVLIFHSLHRFNISTPSVLIPLGWFPGVPIFFVISGYLISASLERSSSLGTYAFRRALRIFPGLWACIVVTLVVTTMCGYDVALGEGVRWLLLQCVGVIYTPAFLASFGVGSYNGSLWTIPVELQFYILLPLLYRVSAGRWNQTAVIATSFVVFLGIGIAGGLLLSEMSSGSEPLSLKLLRYSFLPRFYLFLFGVLLQRMRAHAWPVIRGKALFWLTGYGMFCLVVPQVGAVYVLDELILGLTVLSFAYSKPLIAERMLSGNDISYGVYLYHGLVINIIIERGYQSGWPSVLAVFLTSVAVGYASWRLIERPAAGIHWRGRGRLFSSPVRAPSA